MSNNTSNCDYFLAHTAGPPQMYNAGARYLITSVLAVIVFLCITGNILVIVSVATFRRLRTVTNAFVVSLAVADLGTGVLVMPFQVYKQYNNKVWLLGETFCLFINSTNVMLCTVSIFHLACIIVERFTAVCKPKRYPKFKKPHVVIGMLVCCWVIPIFISFVPVMNKWNTIGIEDMLECILPSENVCFFFTNIEYAWICSIIAWYIPACVMEVYGWITYKSLKYQSLNQYSLENKTSKDKEAKLAKAFLVAIVLSYLLWFPFFILNVIDPSLGYHIEYIPWTVVLWLGYINTDMHPFLYYFMIEDFKIAFQRIIKCKLRGDIYEVNDAEATVNLSGQRSNRSVDVARSPVNLRGQRSNRSVDVSWTSVNLSGQRSNRSVDVVRSPVYLRAKKSNREMYVARTTVNLSDQKSNRKMDVARTTVNLSGQKSNREVDVTQTAVI